METFSGLLVMNVYASCKLQHCETETCVQSLTKDAEPALSG